MVVIDDTLSLNEDMDVVSVFVVVMEMLLFMSPTPVGDPTGMVGMATICDTFGGLMSTSKSPGFLSLHGEKQILK